MKIEVKVFTGEKVFEHTEIVPDAVTKVPRFLNLPDGWIRDLTQGLDWGSSSTKSMNHDEANKFCISKGGRLPTRKELDSLLDLKKKSGVCIDTDYFKDAKSEYYWTSTKVAWASSPSAWCVSFDFGDVSNFNEYCNNYVRPVRSSQ